MTAGPRVHQDGFSNNMKDYMDNSTIVLKSMSKDGHYLSEAVSPHKQWGVFLSTESTKRWDLVIQDPEEGFRK